MRLVSSFRCTLPFDPYSIAKLACNLQTGPIRSLPMSCSKSQRRLVFKITRPSRMLVLTLSQGISFSLRLNSSTHYKRYVIHSGDFTLCMSEPLRHSKVHNKSISMLNNRRPRLGPLRLARRCSQEIPRCKVELSRSDFRHGTRSSARWRRSAGAGNAEYVAF